MDQNEALHKLTQAFIAIEKHHSDIRKALSLAAIKLDEAEGYYNTIKHCIENDKPFDASEEAMKASLAAAESILGKP